MKQTWKFGDKPVIGLSGGIGSGKSFVAGLLAKLGCGIIDADALSRQAMLDQSILQQVQNQWGASYFDELGQLDRKALAQTVFSDPEELKKLEKIVHPYVHQQRKAMRDRFFVDQTVIAIVEDCPLLFEAGLDSEVDVTIFVASTVEKRRQRVRETRGWSAEELDHRQKNQLELDTKAKCADYVVNNNDGEKDCFDQIRIVLSSILQSPDPMSEIST
jgi:dephospho-CoA kinase